MGEKEYDIRFEEALKIFLYWVLLVTICCWLPVIVIWYFIVVAGFIVESISSVVFDYEIPSAYSAPYSLMTCWFIWLVISGSFASYMIYDIWHNRKDPSKLDISSWEDVTPQDKYDKNAASNLSALYGVSMSDYLNYKQTHKKPEEIFDVVQYSKFKQFFHQRKDKLWDKVKTHQLTENRAFDALKQSTRKWMIKRGYDYKDIDSICNNINCI